MWKWVDRFRAETLYWLGKAVWKSKRRTKAQRERAAPVNMLFRSLRPVLQREGRCGERRTSWHTLGGRRHRERWRVRDFSGETGCDREVRTRRHGGFCRSARRGTLPTESNFRQLGGHHHLEFEWGIDRSCRIWGCATRSPAYLVAHRHACLSPATVAAIEPAGVALWRNVLKFYAF